MFKSKNFCHIASNNRNQVKVGVFVYRTPDDVDTVIQSGYFNERIIDINLHDIIIHEQIDPADNTQIAVNTLCVTGRSLDNVTTKVVSTGGGGAVTSVNGQIGDVVLDAEDVGAVSMEVPTAPVLTVAGWSFNSGKYYQTITVADVTSDNVVYVAPYPAEEEEYTDCNVLGVAQADASLTFSCDELPSIDLHVNIVILS